MDSNSRLTQQYTSEEFWHNRNFDKKGKLTTDESAKFDNVFIEGLPYRRKIEENGKTLAGKEAAAEQRRYEKAVAERRALSLDRKRMSLHKTWHFSMPMCCLAILFENHIVGYDQIAGRKMLVVDSVPRSDAKPSNEEERSTLNWRERSWIDVDDEMFARAEAELLTDKNHMSKGTTVHFDFGRVIDRPSSSSHPEQVVWLLRAINSRVHFKMLWIDLAGTTEQTWSNYKKFHGDMRLLEETIELVGERPGEGKHRD